MPDPYQEYQTDSDGNLVDPPTIRDHERRMTEACASGDDAAIQIATEDYTQARRRVADAHNTRVRERRDEDARLLAEDRQRQDADARAQRETAALAAERARADELRRDEESRRTIANQETAAAAAAASDPATAGEDAPLGPPSIAGDTTTKGKGK